MSDRPKYRTKQRELLLAHLQTAPGVHVTAGAVCRALREQGVAIGQATVYRQLEGLVGEGILNKYVIDGKSPACFEYVAPESHGEGQPCYHCKCAKCGRLIHLHCEEVEGMQAHLYAEHGFRLDPIRTVFYGLCDRCA